MFLRDIQAKGGMVGNLTMHACSTLSIRDRDIYMFMIYIVAVAYEALRMRSLSNLLNQQYI